MKENFYFKPAKKLQKSFSRKAIRDARGNILVHAPFQSTKVDPVSVIPPQKKWFQTTRSISQSEVDSFATLKNEISPYEILLNRGKIPYSLYNGAVKNKVKPRARKVKEKRCRISYTSFEEMNSKNGAAKIKEIRQAPKCLDEGSGFSFTEPKSKDETVRIKGQSKRIWNELYKVLDSSDVVAHVLDARDPQGTRCECVEKYLNETAPHKHMIYILNKVDLVPTDVTAQNVKILSKTHPTVAYHANSLKNYYGKDNLFSVFKQFAKLMKKKTISIGFVGYPNIGKSSIINTLRDKKVSSVAPVPGETKTWQYVALTKKIYLIDSPGIVPANTQQALLNGAVRIEKIDDTETLVDKIISTHKSALESVYGFSFGNQDELLTSFCRKYGKIMKNNQPNCHAARIMILKDWMDGKIPYFIPLSDNDK
ncbi:Nucleolar GTP-binding protein 2 [Dictyocoela roeselum]|nr:Nucleolar GTP-binding protein 2 [Dictyocoela roeselum]